jgi:hypothetical protein
MDTAETKPRSSIGWILVALVVGLILGFFFKPGKGKGGGSVETLLGGDPCGGSSATSHEVDINDSNQPCVETTLDSTKSQTVVWSAPANYHPYVVFQNSGIPTPVVTGNTATSVFPAGPNNQPTAAYIVNIVPTRTKLPLPPNPVGQPTPTPGMYGRIIIRP